MSDRQKQRFMPRSCLWAIPLVFVVVRLVLRLEMLMIMLLITFIFGMVRAAWGLLVFYQHLLGFHPSVSHLLDLYISGLCITRQLTAIMKASGDFSYIDDRRNDGNGVKQTNPPTTTLTKLTTTYYLSCTRRPNPDPGRHTYHNTHSSHKLDYNHKDVFDDERGWRLRGDESLLTS